MKTAVDAREIISSIVEGFRLQGTYHKPRCDPSHSATDPADENCLGILFVSAGVSPRAALGDSGVYWADALAKRGYHAFRFDLPGLGDSEGDLSKVADFDSLVNDGAYGPVVSGIANDLVERFHLPGLVAVGNCSGSVTAIYSAAHNERIKGLVLLDPYFHLQQSPDMQKAVARSHLTIFKNLVEDGSPHPALRNAGLKLLSCARTVYYSLGPVLRLLQRRRLPSTANLPLLRSWSQVVARGIPVIVLGSPSLRAKPGEFDYIGRLQKTSGRRLSVKFIDGITHSFAERRSKEDVLQHTQQWLSDCFPVAKCTAIRGAEPFSTILANAISTTAVSPRYQG